MPLNIRFDGDVVVLSNFARLMNDPRYVDAARDLGDLLDQGVRKFVIDLTGVRETGAAFLGLLMTLTRRIRQGRGEAVLAHPSREMEAFLLDEMQMEEYWDILPSVQEAVDFYRRAPR
jgi:anti-sigma B factor antagonist